MTVNFRPPEDSVHHECESYRKGDWIVFRCPICHDYERRFNWRTGEMTVHDSRADVFHSGKHIPAEYKSAFENRN